MLAGGDNARVAVAALDAQASGTRSLAEVAHRRPRGRSEVWLPVVRSAFPRGDDEDFNMRAPLDGPGGWPPDLNVLVPADGPGWLLPGLVVWPGEAEGATLERGRATRVVPLELRRRFRGAGRGGGG